LDATQPKYAKHFRMYSYIVEELVSLIFTHFPVEQGQCGIFGFSMGGHGFFFSFLNGDVSVGSDLSKRENKVDQLVDLKY
jgi:hypothetical protein